MKPLYEVQITCQMCETMFQSPKVRPSFKKTLRKDADFCGYYKEVNPDDYVVRVCPSCGFASTENFSEQVTERQSAAFIERIGSQWTQKDYNGTRSWEEAVQTYKLALVCAQIKEENPRLIAGILHHLAWLYREKQDHSLEHKFLEHALQAYIEVYEMESTPLN